MALTRTYRSVRDLIEQSRQILERSRQAVKSGDETLQHVQNYLATWAREKRTPSIESTLDRNRIVMDRAMDERPTQPPQNADFIGGRDRQAHDGARRDRAA